jgi:hypothetical protein
VAKAAVTRLGPSGRREALGSEMGYEAVGLDGSVFLM